MAIISGATPHSEATMLLPPLKSRSQKGHKFDDHGLVAKTRLTTDGLKKPPPIQDQLGEHCAFHP